MFIDFMFMNNLKLTKMSKNIIFILILFISTSLFAQNTEKDIVVVEEQQDETRIKVPGVTVIVNHAGDTITRIVLGNRQLEIIDNMEGTTKVRMVHAPRNKFKGHWEGFELGLNNFFSTPFDSKLPEDIRYMDLNASKSVSVGLNLLQHSMSLSKHYKNNFGLVTGIGLTFNNYRFDSQHVLTRMDNGDTYYVDSPRSVDKNKLVTTFLTVPLLLEFQIPDHKDRPFYVNAGVYGGFKTGSHIKMKYNDNLGAKKEKFRKDINLNPFKYGVTARVGYRCVNLFATCDLSQLFQAGQGPEIYPWSVGISLTDF